MGQNVTVIAKPSSNPTVRRFEINRSLTGMGHERYDSLADVVDDRAVDQIARKLLEHGGVSNVHINSSVITVRLAGGSTGDGLEDIIRNMFRFYGDEPGAAIDADANDAGTDDEVAESEIAESEVAESEVATSPESAADHAVAAESTPAEASDAPGDAPEPQPGEREPGEATAAAEDTSTNL